MVKLLRRRRANRYRKELHDLAREHAGHEVILETLLDVADRHLPDRPSSRPGDLKAGRIVRATARALTIDNRDADKAARAWLSALNRVRLGDPPVPADPMTAVAEAVVNIGDNFYDPVHHTAVRDFLSALWGWSEDDAADVVRDAAFNDVPRADRPVLLFYWPTEPNPEGRECWFDSDQYYFIVQPQHLRIKQRRVRDV
jgi:hypothetical protein